MDIFTESILIIVGLGVVGIVLVNAIIIAKQWDRAVILRLGKFKEIAGPGLVFLIPFVDRVTKMIDTRVITSPFNAEQTLTKDTVPVNVDAVLFWQVVDVKKAALEVFQYEKAVSLAAQTALRDIIGKTELSLMLTGREAIDNDLLNLIGTRVEGWGIKVQSVEIKDVIIPSALQDAMSMQAQAERERQARVILGDSERQIAEKFEEAAKHYEHNPTAMHLRGMNMLYEGLKSSKSTIILVPSSAIDTMNMGAVPGLVAMAENQKKIVMPETP